MTNIKIIYNLEIPMRDGVILRADLYRPDNSEKYPAVLLRFPYNKDVYSKEWGQLSPIDLAKHGYNVIVQDIRGSGDSDGVMDFTASQGPDGYDSIEWIAVQDFCDGNVGMYGLSYYGFTQLVAAAERPPHLKCICPWQQAGNPKYKGGFTIGTLHLRWLLEKVEDYLSHSNYSEEEKAEIRNEVLKGTKTIESFLPEAEIPVTKIKELPYLKDYSERVRYCDDPLLPKREGRPIDFNSIDVPCFFLAGWYDDSSKNGPIENWIAMQNSDHDQSLKDNCKLLVGPWNHGTQFARSVGERNFGTLGPDGRSVQDCLIDFLNFHLKGIQSEFMSHSSVCIYTMGSGAWKYENHWPLNETKYCSFYLQSNGDSAADMNAGALVTEKPDRTGSDSYLYDPQYPVPSRVKGISSECQNWATIDNRDDVLVYTTPVLDSDLEVTGAVYAELYISSDCPDTDFMCRLSEVYPDGRSINITDGAVRASYNNSYERDLLKPGEIRKVTVEMGNTSNLFMKGNRIRLSITSSNYPKYDRNHNTGDPIGLGDKLNIARNTVFYGSPNKSVLMLPIIPI